MQFAVRAKRREIDSMRLLAEHVELTDLLGRIIHALQRERGATSVYLGSHGQRFASERHSARMEAEPLIAQLRERFDQEWLPARDASARLLSLIAWVLLDLDSLRELRIRIDAQAVSAPDSVVGFSKVISGLMELIFQLADGAAEPSISRLLVALVHVVQGKEEAGQERAVGAHMFAAGQFSPDQLQRLMHLIGAQERSFDVFVQFAQAPQWRWWKERALAPHAAVLEKLRHTLCATRPGEAVETGLSETWFEVCSARITDLWHLQMALTVYLRQACGTEIDRAQQALRDSEALLKHWRNTPPPHAQAVEHFFGVDAAVTDAAVTDAPRSVVPEAAAGAHRSDRLTVAGLKTALQEQSARLARAEVKLDEARRTLHVSKVVQRAKSTLMTHLGMSEAAAFRLLQKTSMDRNQPILQVAEEVLLSPESLFERWTPSKASERALRRKSMHQDGSPQNQVGREAERSAPRKCLDASITTDTHAENSIKRPE